MDSTNQTADSHGRTVARLPVWRTATDAWRALVDGRDVLAVVLAVAFVPAGVVFLEEPLRDALPEAPALLGYLVSLLLAASGCAAAAYVASYWHRFVLLGRDDVLITLPSWTPATTRIFWWIVGLSLFGAIVSLLLVLILIPLASLLEAIPALPGWAAQLPVWLMLLLEAYVVTRLCLALPAAALGGPMRSLRGSWRVTAGNGWKLVGTTALVLIPLGPAAWVASRLFAAGGVRAVLGAALMAVTSLLVVAVQAGVLSLAYRHLVLARGLVDEAAEPADRPDPAAEAGVGHLARRSGLLDG